jgi:hypothetical protein
MEEWQEELIENPPPSSKVFSKEEWISIVLTELITDPRKTCNIGQCNPYYGKTHTSEIKKRMSDSTKQYYNNLTPEQRKIIHGNNGSLNGMHGTSRTGEQNPMYGKRHTEETKDKIRKKALGKLVSNEAKTNMSKAQSRRWTDEEKSKRSIEYKSRGHKPPSSKGMLWWNNGVDVTRSLTCPGENWVKGRKIG